VGHNSGTSFTGHRHRCAPSRRWAGLDGKGSCSKRSQHTIRPDGTALKRLTNSAGNDAHAAWSPDGQWLAFSSARGGFKDEMARGGGGQGATDVFVMRSDGSEVRRLTDDSAEEGTVTFSWK
jgi:dipeptidyl aminopeptidase/acylaminoacyl peptidase